MNKISAVILGHDNRYLYFIGWRYDGIVFFECV